MKNDELKQNVISMIVSEVIIYIIFLIATILISYIKQLQISFILEMMIGIILGFIFSVFFIIHMAHNLNIALDMAEQGARFNIAKQKIIRALVFAIIFILLIKIVSNTSALFMATSILTIKLSIYMTPMIKNKLYKQR